MSADYLLEEQIRICKVMEMEEYGFDLRHSLPVMLAATLGTCAAAVMAEYPGLVPGLFFGCMGSMAYFFLLSFQMQRGCSMDRERAKRYLQGSWVPRFCLITVIVLLAVRLPDVNMVCVIIGLFVPFRFVILFNGLVLWIRDFNQADEIAATKTRRRRQGLPEPVNAISEDGWPWSGFFVKLYNFPTTRLGVHKFKHFHM